MDDIHNTKIHLKSEKQSILFLSLKDAFKRQTHASMYKYKQLLNRPIYFIRDHFACESSGCACFLWTEFEALTGKP